MRAETILNREAWDRIGGLSEPSKMPCYGYSIPASRCKLGSILQRIQGTTCFNCYALKGRYTFANVIAALERRYASLASLTWIDDMVRVILWKEKSGYFRWHDSGDLQSVEHLEKIVAVCRQLPGILFWLPTREAGIVKEYLAKHGEPPVNLTIRLSATKIDSDAVDIGLPTSTVVSDKAQATCKAPKQGGECKSCRACWSKKVKNVSYKKH
jgi:Gene product 88